MDKKRDFDISQTDSFTSASDRKKKKKKAVSAV